MFKNPRTSTLIVPPDLAIITLSNEEVCPRNRSCVRYKTSTSMQSTSENLLWSPSQSLWNLIVEHVPGSDLPKIHRALGASLVDMYTEVHTEVVMWHKMWQESQQSGTFNSSAGTPAPPRWVPLADPPAVKELVRAEVRMLLQNLKEKAVREGRPEDQFLFRYKPETVNFALGRCDSRTHLGDNETESRPSSQCSVQSSVDEFEAVKDKLNVSDIDQVVGRIRSVLTEECEALKRQVKHIQENIKKKCGSKPEQAEPSLAELKELRGALQTDLELCSFSPSSPASPLSVKTQANSRRLSAGPVITAKTLQAFTGTSVQRPHPPSAPRSQSKTPTPVCTRIITSRQRNIHLPSSIDQTTGEQDSAALHRRTLTCSHIVQINSPNQLSHLSPNYTINNPSREVDLSSQTNRKRDLVLKLKNNISSSIPAHNSLCDGGCSVGGHGDNITDHSLSTAEKSNAHTGPQNSLCGGSSLSETVQTEIGKCFQPGVTRNYLKRNDESDRNKEQIQSDRCVTVYTSHHPARNSKKDQATYALPKLIQVNGQFFTPTTRPPNAV